MPETCRAKDTSVTYLFASSWQFTLFHDEDAGQTTLKFTTQNSFCYDL